MNGSYTFLIVEDEMLIAESIASILKLAGYVHIRIVDSIDDALAEIKRQKPDIVLTDISLQKAEEGIQLGGWLFKEHDIPFIYITSHSSRPMLEKAKHTRPAGYIKKPFRKEDILIAVEFALFNSRNKPSEIGELIVKNGRTKVKICFDEILYLHAEGNYTTIYLKNGARSVLRGSMTDLENQLTSERFVRIHKSYIVNLSAVTKAKSGSVFLSETQLPVGRTYQASVNSAFKS